MLKINAGAGSHPMPGWVNGDKFPESLEVEKVDFEKFPWPWENSSVDEMLFNHTLEHMGQAPDVFLGIMSELYRVCCDGAIIHVNVPHPRHDEFLGDPTHCRPILPDTFVLFSKAANKVFRESNGANSCFAFQLNVDFEVISNEVVLDDRFAYLKDDPNWQRFAAINNNVIRELKIRLKVIKPNV